ncbi:MAG: CoA-binding protein [Thermodesulfobacteriota bacterium]
MKASIRTEEPVNLDLLFKPRSLAVIGISKDPGRGGGFIWFKIQSQGYPGKKFPISRSCTELDGIACYPSLSEIEEPIDLAVAAIPAAGVEKMLIECAQKGIKFVVIHAAGFAELGEEGRGLQKRVLAIARENTMRLVGPNCMGIFCPESRLNTIVELEPSEAVPGGVAFSGQSGWATEHFVIGGAARGLRFSKVISSGNQADLGFFDFLSYFGQDASTRVVCSYLEGLGGRGRELLRLAGEIGRSKPVIIWKSGFSQAGTRAALSHSGSVTGKREIWLGAARSAGIVTAEGFEDLMDLAVAFSCPPYPKGKRVGIMAEAGGGGISTADACERLGLEVNTFSPGLRERLTAFLKDYLPPFSGTSNPLDLVWLPRETALTICSRSIELMAEEVDAVITMSYMPFVVPEMLPPFMEKIKELRDRLQLPIYLVPPYAAKAIEAVKTLTLAGLPALPSFERAARAMAATREWRAWRDRGQE